MRPYLAIAIAIAIVLIAGFAAKILFLPNQVAEAQLPAGTVGDIDVFKMHLDHPTIGHLPEQTVKEPF
jgi:hypothetical protein